MQNGKVFQVPPFARIHRFPGPVHPLHQRGHVPEDGGVHQGADQHDHHGKGLLAHGVGRDVAEPDRGEGGAGVIEGRDVGDAMRYATAVG